MPDIKTTEIHSYLERTAFFQTARNGLHGAPHELTQMQENRCRGRNDRPDDTPEATEKAVIRACHVSKGDRAAQLGTIGEPDTGWHSRPIDVTGRGRENRGNSEISKETLPLWSGYPLGILSEK
jgi:hypothetical protein